MDYRVNEKIRAREVRVIDENGKNLGVMHIKKALRLARERGLDLVEIAPTANPPVCRIVDWGKFKYERKKKERELKRKQKAQELKEIMIRSKIDKSGMEIKEKTIRRLLDEGHKVRITVRLIGSAVFKPQLAKTMLEELLNRLSDVAKVEEPPRTEGRHIFTTIAPIQKNK